MGLVPAVGSSGKVLFSSSVSSGTREAVGSVPGIWVSMLLDSVAPSEEEVN